MATEDQKDVVVDLDQEPDPSDAGEGAEGETPEGEGIPDYNDGTGNLVPLFVTTREGKAALKTISDKVLSDFDAAWESTEEYRQRYADNWKQVIGDLPPKQGRFKDMANAHVPICLENLMRLTFRIESEVFNNWEQIFNIVPVNFPFGSEQAEIMTKHDNWQLRQKISSFKREASRMVSNYFFQGDVTVQSYYHYDTRNNCHEVVIPDEFVTPYQVTETTPDWSASPFRVRICRYYAHQIEGMEESWHDVDKVLAHEPPSWIDEPEKKTADAVAQTSGIDPEAEVEQPYKLYWYEGWVKLPLPSSATKADPKAKARRRFCRAIVDSHTRAILELLIYETEDWQDRLRFDAQQAELDSYRQQQQIFQETQAQNEEQIKQTAQQAIDQHAQGKLAPLQGEIVQQGLDQALAVHQSAEPPTPPGWAENPDDPNAAPEPVRRVPIQLWAHGVCIEPMAGNLGIGYGTILGDFNRAADTALSQFIDMATFGNVPGFISADIFDIPTDFVLSPMKITKIPGITPSQLKESLIPIKPDIANPQLLEVVKTMYQWGQSSVQAPNVLSGEPGKSGETYRGIATRVEQANKQQSVAARKVGDIVVTVAKNNGKLNAIFLPQQEVVAITDPYTRKNEQLPISRDMWREGYDVEMRADMRLTTQSMKVQEADELLGLIQAQPALQANVPFVLMAMKKALEARGLYDMIPLLIPPQPPMGQTPPQGGPPQGGPPQGNQKPKPKPKPAPAGVPGPGGPLPSTEQAA